MKIKQDKASAAETQPTRGDSTRIEPGDVMYTHQVGDGPAKGWIHTHGLANCGLPELEIRDVPLLLGKQAATLLEGIADYMLNTPSKPVVAGHNMRLNGSMFRFTEASADDGAGYDTNHYDGVTRLQLVDMEGHIPCYVCEKDQCSSECPEDAAGNLPTKDHIAVATAKGRALYERERERLGARAAHAKMKRLLEEPYARIPCLIRIDEELGYVWGNVLVVCVADAKFMGRHEDAQAAIAEAQQADQPGDNKQPGSAEESLSGIVIDLQAYRSKCS
jgi:hypothetical protein